MSAALDLGPLTERLLEETFSRAALATAQDAAKVLGVDTGTLREMDEAGLIGGVIAGEKTRRYTEADLRAYLAGQPPISRCDLHQVRRRKVKQKAKPCPSTNPPKAATGPTTSNSKVVGFTEARARRRAAKPKR